MMMVAANVRADGTDMARSGQRGAGAGAGEEIGRGGVSAREFQPVWMLVEVHLLTRRRFVINCHSSQGTSAITMRSTRAFPGLFWTSFWERGCHKKKTFGEFAASFPLEEGVASVPRTCVVTGSG